MRAEMKEKISTSSDYFLNYSITKAQSLFSPKESIHSTCDTVPVAIFTWTIYWCSEQEGLVSILLSPWFKSLNQVIKWGQYLWPNTKQESPASWLGFGWDLKGKSPQRECKAEQFCLSVTLTPIGQWVYGCCAEMLRMSLRPHQREDCGIERWGRWGQLNFLMIIAWLLGKVFIMEDAKRLNQLWF